MGISVKEADPIDDIDFSWEVKANDRSYHNKIKKKGLLCFQRKKYALHSVEMCHTEMKVSGGKFSSDKKIKEEVVLQFSTQRRRRVTSENNVIKTSKYNLLNFIPLNLYEQFHQAHVIYFTFVLLLQSIPQIQTQPTFIIVIPLACILIVRGLRDIVNDITRQRSDTLINNKSCEILRDKTFQTLKWKDIHVGDIVCLRKDDFVPADILLLYTTETNGVCYVETAGIDGETNLKFRLSVMATYCALQTSEALSEFNGIVTCETPNSLLHSFVGVLSWKGRKYPLNNENILLRDCRVRNTDICYGLVIYAGCDTKIMKNAGKVTIKRSKVDAVIGKCVAFIVIILVFVTLLLAIGAGIWDTLYSHRHNYIPRTPGLSSFSVGFYMFWGYLAMLSTLVPFFLFISMEFMYTIHNYYIKQDIEMYHSESDTPAQAKGYNLCDLLGQVDFIFTDKTGTLTQNVMTFKKCCIGQRIFGATSNTEKEHQEVSFAWNKYASSSFQFYDQSLCQEIRGSQDPLLHEFFRAISLCHTVMSDNKEEGSLMYKAASPDEEALVTAARNFGFVFHSRTQDSITVIELGEERTYEILALLDFSSSRKRMSILVRNEEGKIKLYTKGADSVLLQRLHPSSETDDFIHVLDQFAEETLRTLCLAYKEVDEHEYVAWKVTHHEASVTLSNREDALGNVYDDMESNLQLLGATAIEDKLQDGVPETIKLLKDGNIKIWMLTGDKQETAVNIAYSCNLLSGDMQIVEENDLRCLLEATDDLNESNLRLLADSSSRKALVITGDFLSKFFQSGKEEEISLWQKLILALQRKNGTHLHTDPRTQTLVDLACQYQSVICCRMTPKQKASIVKLVKTNKEVTTLAIGDGGNDVNMLKTAHIGVGIIGKEGLQAVLASDFGLAQFFYLQKLLFYHGRLSYLRTSNFLCFYNYKTFASLFSNIWYGFFNGFSALAVSESWFLILNAILYTLFPTLYLAMVDKDLDSETSLRYPHLYIRGQSDSHLCIKIFINILYGIYTSLVMFFVPYFGFFDTVGGIFDYQVFIYAMSNIYILAILSEVLLAAFSYTLLLLLAIGISVIGYFVISLVTTLPGAYFANTMNFNNLGAMLNSISSGYMWFLFLLGTVLSVMPSLFCRLWSILSSPVEKQMAPANEKNVELRSVLHRGSYRRRSSYAFSHYEGFARNLT
ncbi:phospholipid-transporting ATPase IK-like [Engystomops pustulosus]|uniref:phospholipid-transporting ATPase IK-like n=1 Tax=Engystomops pustulosus TaxID=76066 RepID=UPI003AFB333C